MPSDAFIGILQGLGQKYQEHNQNLLSMEISRRQQLADLTEKIATMPGIRPEAMSALLNSAYQIRSVPYEKKLPKELENPTSQILTQGVAPQSGQSWLGGQTQRQVQAQPMPIAAQIPEPDPNAPIGTLNPATGELVTGSRSGLPPEPNTGPTRTPEPSTYTAPMPTPPSAARMPAFESEQEQLAKAERAARMGGGVKADIMLQEETAKMRAIDNELQRIGITDPRVRAELVTGHTPRAMNFSVPSTVAGTEIMNLTPTDIAGRPIDPAKHYNVRMEEGRWFATPVEAPTVGGMRFAQDQSGQWVGYTTDRFGKINVQSNLGLTPPVGVPTTSINQGIRIVQQPNGDWEEVPITTSTTRQRGTPSSAAPPIPAPAATPAAPGTPPPKPTAPVINTTPVRTGAGQAGQQGRVVGGRSLTPEQMLNNTNKSQAFSNMIARMTNVLEKAPMLENLITAGKIALAVDPKSPTKLLLSRYSEMTPDEAGVAGDYLSLGEDINLLRGVFQATGFRGPEAFATQQAQRGPLLGDPKVFNKVLTNSLKASIDQLKGINQQLTRAGQPVELTPAIMKAYMILNGNDENKALAEIKKDKWTIQ